MSLFSTNMAISKMTGQGLRAILTQLRKASDILTPTLVAFLLNSYPNTKSTHTKKLKPGLVASYKRGLPNVNLGEFWSKVLHVGCYSLHPTNSDKALSVPCHE